MSLKVECLDERVTSGYANICELPRLSFIFFNSEKKLSANQCVIQAAIQAVIQIAIQTFI